MTPLGRPRLHLRTTASTNDRARELAAAGAPHGTLVTASAQTAGRGRQGRTWVAPAGRALLMSLIVRELEPLLSLRAGLAVADAVDGLLGRVDASTVKWPNDVRLDGLKVAGVLVEGRPQEGWAVIGIGLNVAVESFPSELHGIAGTLGLAPADVEPALERLLAALTQRLSEPAGTTISALRRRDALLDQPVRWAGGEGTGAGVDSAGRLLVRTVAGEVVTLDAGEVHLTRQPPER